MIRRALLSTAVALAISTAGTSAHAERTRWRTGEVKYRPLAVAQAVAGGLLTASGIALVAVGLVEISKSTCGTHAADGSCNGAPDVPLGVGFLGGGTASLVAGLAIMSNAMVKIQDSRLSFVVAPRPNGGTAGVTVRF